jgi:glycopeptide antibiotics resistance protein
MVIIVVVVCNLGGLYNAIVYTIIRRRYTKVSGVENNSAMQTGNTNAD